MDDDGGLFLIVVLAALGVGGYFLVRKPPMLPGGMIRGVGYMPNKQAATVAGISAIAAVASKGIDAWMSSDDNKTEIALAEVKAGTGEESNLSELFPGGQFG